MTIRRHILEEANTELLADNASLRAELTEAQNRGAQARSDLILQSGHILEEAKESSDLYLLINDEGQYYFGNGDWDRVAFGAFSYSKSQATEFAAEKRCKIISKSDAEKRDSDDRWLINQSPISGHWFRAAGNGTTPSVNLAHRYTWMEAMTHHCMMDTGALHHISSAEVSGG